MDRRFELSDRVVCIKPYDKLKVRDHYSISGCGNLECNMDKRVNGKTGYGYGIKHEEWNRSTGKTDVTYYYFTEKEMDEYFITEDEDYKSYMREQKINQIFYENSTGSTR